MSIRKRLFFSYFLLVLLVVLYGLLLYTFGFLQKGIDEDIKELHRTRSTWNDLLISMNSLQLNWNNGSTYELFKDKYISLEELIKHMADDTNLSIIGRSEHMRMRRTDLYNTWNFASDSVASIISVIETPGFQSAIRPLEKQSGLQRLNHLWMELYNNSDVEDKRSAYIIRQVIDIIEFFPIYSETVNHLFDVILLETEEMVNHIQRIQSIVTFVFFLLFLLLYMVFAIRLSKSLSKPIIRMSMKLSSFIGQTLKLEKLSETNELKLLESSVESLIDHYTYLAMLAERLALGDIDTSIIELPKQGVVGHALKDINLYLLELAKTSQWIREGKYGAEIRVKSESDVLAENFNIMSQVINEKISTLQNVFEAVEEGIVVTNEEGWIIEVNSNFIRLTGIKDEHKSFDDYRLEDFFNEPLTVLDCLNSKTSASFYCEINDLSGSTCPVKIVSRYISGRHNRKPQHMFFITNESIRVRMEREKETLRIQAVEAELMALRAQINPHFLFNTLNGIAHLIESGTDDAVKMIEELSDLFRYSLSSTRRRTVALSEELNIVRQYLNIERMRFEDKLSVVFNIDEDEIHTAVPPMILQPLVENAIKHGVDDEGRVDMEIVVKREENYRIISIGDRGSQVLNLELLYNQKGTGIRNVNQRLVTLYNRELRFKKNIPQGLIVEITIP